MKMDFKTEDMSLASSLSVSQNVDEIMNFRTPCIKIMRRSSFFRPDELSKTKIKTDPKTDVNRSYYMEALEKERGDWMSLARKINERAKSLVLKKNGPIDSSILPEPRREYLEEAVDLESWLKEADDFSQNVYGYIKHKEWLMMRLKYVQEQLADKLIDASCKSF